MNAGAPLQAKVLVVSRGIAGAYCARLVADLGAECSWLKWAERPGDWPSSPLFRSYFDDGIEVVERPASLAETLDTVANVAGGFDAVITDLSASELPEGALYDRLRSVNPAVVVANVDHFGRTGPYARWAGDEVTDYALGAYWALAGEPGREPLRVPGYQAQFHAGQQLAIALLAALRHARLTGQGQEVETTGMEAMLGAHWSTTVAWTHEGRILKREGSDLFRAADGWVFFYRMGLYQNLFLLIDRPDLMEDERFSSITAWLANAGDLWGMVEEWCATKQVDDIVQTAQELRIPVTPMATAEMLLNDAGLKEREFFRSVDSHRLPGMPYRWSSGWDRPRSPATLAGALAAPSPVEVAPALPITADRLQSVGGPLSGIRVLELTNNWAGPIAGRHLGDLGAEVIKIELATKPATRLSHYPGKEPGKYHWNRSGYFNEMNRNKRDLSLNLATERGRDIFLELVGMSDVVVENNSARVMPGLGLGYDRLSQVNPRLVMASISGFGATGPRRDWVAFGSNIEAACGLAAVTGYDDGRPYRTGSFVADPIAGAHAVVGILAALERRDRTGEGAQLDIALTESAMPFMLQAFCHFQEHGSLFPRMANRDPDFAPVGAYPCAGTDDWVAIAVRSDDQWAALCAATGLGVALGRDPDTRLENRDKIDRQLAGWSEARTQYECVRLLQARGVPAAPILHNYQLHSDPHLFARNAFIPIEHPDTGVMPYPGFPWRLGGTPPTVRAAAPRFAEANAYVFRKLLGLTAGEVEQLYAEGVTADEPEGLVPVVV